MSTSLDLKTLLAEVATGRPLTTEEAESAFGIIMSGDATPAQAGGFLMALRTRGETVDEITAAARIMRSKMLSISSPDDAVDTVGTGGDAKGTLNVSSAVAIVVAGCGVRVAKHGNKALSSKSGAADVLSALGINLDADMSLIEEALRDVGLCFLMAPRHHSATRHVAGVLVELGTRTVFNLLGPLTNPAGAKRQLVGVFASQWVEPMAHVLKNLGSKRAWVAHGSDGIDELTVTGPSHVASLNADGSVETFDVTPEDAGLKIWHFTDILGGDPEHNAERLTALLAGEVGAYRDIVLLNSAATLVVAEKAETLVDGVALAAHAIDSGAARSVLQGLVTVTNRETA